ncbi:hypothetical protein DL96DRAFT_1723996 [Flagelloscypha sp. PMI_526]|nr:hypothetical protein DL96DRAFT_1723996 [Flagelloscypha sp. PMI_526]
MPSPAIYVVAVVGAVAAGIAFKEFVYDPHIAPVIEAAIEKRRQRRNRGHVRLEDPVSSYSSLRGSGSGVEMKERRGSGLRRRGIVPHSPKEDILFSTDIDKSTSSSYQPSSSPSPPPLNEKQSSATIRSPNQRSRTSAYIPSPSLPAEIDAGFSSSFLLESASSLRHVPSVQVEQASPTAERFNPQPPQHATPDFPSLSISHPVSLLDSDGEVVSRPDSVVSGYTSSLSASTQSESRSESQPEQSIYHSFLDEPNMAASATASRPGDAEWTFPSVTHDVDLMGLVTPLSPSTSTSSLSELDMRSNSSRGVDLLSDMDVRSVRSDNDEDLDDLESVGTVDSAVDSLASWDDGRSDFGSELR